MKNNGVAMSIILLFLSLTPADAAIKSSGENHFEIVRVLAFEATADEVYRAIVEEVGSWWSPSHTFSGESSNLMIEPTANGCFCETLPDGGSARHLGVAVVRPGKMIRLIGGLGPLQQLPVSGVMSFELNAAEKTRLSFSYRVAGGENGTLKNWADPVNRVLMEQLDRLKRWIDTGSPD